MLQIRLNKGSCADSGPGAKAFPAETVTVACPEHLVLADLPVAKGLGSTTATSTVKVLGRRSRRQLTDRVHFCVRCDFPIAIYGRLSPCEHAFCLDCARSDSVCYICDERIQKIQTIKLMEEIFICAAPHCIKSFLKKSEFEAHVYKTHADLVKLNIKKGEIKEPQELGTNNSSTLDSTLHGPPRPGFSSNSNPQLNDREDKSCRQQQPPAMPAVHLNPAQYYGQPHLSDAQANARSTGIDGLGPSLDPQGGMRQDYGQPYDKQQGVLSSDPHHHGYPPLYPSRQQPHFQMPNPPPMLLGPPPFGFPSFPPNGGPPFYSTPVSHEGTRSDPNAADGGPEQGSVLGFGQMPEGGVGFPEGYPHPWGGGQGILAAPLVQAQAQAQAMPPPPPPPGPPPPHLLQHKHGHYSGDMTNDGKNY